MSEDSIMRRFFRRLLVLGGFQLLVLLGLALAHANGIYTATPSSTTTASWMGRISSAIPIAAAGNRSTFNPMLGPLQFNDGPVFTHELLTGHPAFATPSRLPAAKTSGTVRHPAVPFGNGGIIFFTSRDGNGEIYVMDEVGGNQTNLTNNLADDKDPAWSPDRTKIAFSTNRDGNYEIYVMDANGSNPIRLTNNAASDLQSAWSPDGTKIAFTSQRDGHPEVYVMDANGSNQVRLTNGPTTNSEPTWSPDGTKIAFSTDRDGQSEIYRMDANGANQINLTNTPGNDSLPAWSPDGTKIAFTSQRDGNLEIYVMDASGANQTRLTNNSATDDDPRWAPNGNLIAFHSSRDGNEEIYAMDANGANQTNLTNNPATDSGPDWGIPIPPPPTPTATATATGSPPPTPTPTPPGVDKIIFVTDRDGNDEIYAMDPDGGNQTNLTNDPAFDENPAWSPDGTRIAFKSFRDGNYEIYVMDANGANPTRLTNNKADDNSPSWSPDGTKITFATDRDGQSEIYVMDANGANPIRLTNNPAFDSKPVWSPDGTKIAFTSDRDGNTEIYLMDANGANPVNLTNNKHEDSAPSWSPDGAKIAFATDRDGSFQAIYLMDANGSNQFALTAPQTGSDTAPIWSPDGSKIAFVTNRDDNYEIYVMNVNGSNQLRLTNNSALDDSPAWQISATIPSPTPTPGPSSTASPSVTPTPTPSPARALNISTRLRVQTDNNVLIGGFIITSGQPRPWPFGESVHLSALLASPMRWPILLLNCETSNGTLIMQNDNWQDDPTQAAQLSALGLAPQDSHESGLVTTLTSNASYTAILAGKDNGTGIGLVEIYDADLALGGVHPTGGGGGNSQLANISTRGFVLADDNVMIGGFILGGSLNTQVALRGIGPSLADFGLSPVLADPTLELHDSNGATLMSNDNWQDDPTQAAQLSSHGLAPTNPHESGIVASLPPGAFTAILAGKDGGTGIGLVEIYNLQLTEAADPDRHPSSSCEPDGQTPPFRSNASRTAGAHTEPRRATRRLNSAPLSCLLSDLPPPSEKSDVSPVAP